MVAVFREVRRVLRDDGTIWVNLGDSYAANGARSNNNGTGKSTMGWPGQNTVTLNKCAGMELPPIEHGLKPKDLVGIPWRIAFALQADGWYLRSDIIWSKPNPMPESVTDRPTKAHEYIFLLSKSERYYFDQSAVREKAVCEKMPGQNMTDTRMTYGEQNGGNSGLRDLRRKVRSPAGWDTGDGAHGSVHRDGREQATKYNEIMPDRNIRSVWTIATQPYPEAHFATFPEDLIKPCILAGCQVGGIVLDPFSGSGTTVKVAQDLGRRGVGLELSEDYLTMAQRRTAQQGFIL
jgi:DNA modification methylase